MPSTLLPIFAKRCASGHQHQRLGLNTSSEGRGVFAQRFRHEVQIGVHLGKIVLFRRVTVTGRL